MTATYDATLPTAKDRLRFALGDTTMTDVLEQDETYVAALTLYSEPLATAVMAEALAARFAREPDSISGAAGSISWRERVKTWLALAERMRGAVATTSGAMAGTMIATRGDETQSEYVRPTDQTWWTG